MEDSELVELFNQKKEEGLSELPEEYGDNSRSYLLEVKGDSGESELFSISFNKVSDVFDNVNSFSLAQKLSIKRIAVISVDVSGFYFDHNSHKTCDFVGSKLVWFSDDNSWYFNSKYRIVNTKSGNDVASI